MSIELKLDEENDEKENNNLINNSKEHKWKELLYELFYEIKSELLGCKIEIDEEEYQENLKIITIPILINYIHDSIKILIKKKIEDFKKEQKYKQNKYNLELDKINTQLLLDERTQYENIIIKLESKERNLTKKIFQDKLQRDAMENKIGEYIEMEEEFEEMKTKLKYEEGRFLDNDRKDNEILIIRTENSNLKKTLMKLENKIKNLENDKLNNNKTINKLNQEIKKLKLKLEDFEKQNEMLKAHYINININNVTGGNNKNGILQNNINNIDFKDENIFSKKNNINNKIFPYKKIKNKFFKDRPRNADILCSTRNESLERTQSDLLNKYFIGNKINLNNNIGLNNSSLKVNYFPSGNNQLGNSHKKENNRIPLFTNRNYLNNFNISKKIISTGRNSGIRSNSTNINGNMNKQINFI